jgi:hypothetical protein
MSSITEVCAWLVGWLISVLIGALIGRDRGDTEIGAVLAFFLGPVGWLITALLPDKRLRCARCGTLLWIQALQCPACHKSCASPNPCMPVLDAQNNLQEAQTLEDILAKADRLAAPKTKTI